MSKLDKSLKHYQFRQEKKKKERQKEQQAFNKIAKNMGKILRG